MNKLKNFNNFYLNFLKNKEEYKNYDLKELIELNNLFTKIIKESKIADLILNSNNEINNNKDNINYYIIKCVNKDKNLVFSCYLFIYYLLSKKDNNDLILSIDFEFNSKKIALMQINFETKFKDRFIFILYPPDLSNYWKSFLIKKILGNKNILKLLHGSDSLDIPYLFDDLIIRKKYIKKFMNNFIDTKFLCEYFNYQNNFTDRKCKIYELLLDNKIISKKKYKELEINSEKMGHIYDIFIDINTISKELLKYSVYDVIYLKYLYNFFPKNKNYKQLIPELTRIIILDRREITNYFNYINNILNSMNNYFIKKKNNIKLIEIYKNKTNNLNLSKYNIEILIQINYFKNLIEVIKKYLIYKILIQKYKINVNKKKLLNKKLPEIKLNKKYIILKEIINLMFIEIKKNI